MTKIEALTDLLAKVKAGDLHTQKYGGMPIVTAMYQHFGGFGAGVWNDARFMSAYHGSLDAAIALCESVLPDSTLMIGNKKPRALVQCDHGLFFEAAETPARSLLIAILEALIAMEKTDDQ